MPLQLRDDLFWCNCQGRAIFLDTAADRYFCLPPAANDAFLRLAVRGHDPGDAQRLATLVDAGLLRAVDGDEPIRPPPLSDAPTHDSPHGGGIDAIATLQALASESRMVRALRTQPFHQVVEMVRGARPRGGKGDPDPSRAVGKIVSGFAAAALLTGSHDRCLVRALAVQSACKRSGIASKLVFGVVAHPFAAHSWVQLGLAVLVGGFEQARLYTPILIVE